MVDKTNGRQFFLRREAWVPKSYGDIIRCTASLDKFVKCTRTPQQGRRLLLESLKCIRTRTKLELLMSGPGPAYVAGTLDRSILAEGAARAARVACALPIYVRPIITPQRIAETHQITRRSYLPAAAPKAEERGREGEMEGDRVHDGRGHLNHPGLELSCGISLVPFVHFVRFFSVLPYSFIPPIPFEARLKNKRSL